MITTTQTEELEVQQESSSSNNSREALLNILPSIRETYCTLLRVSNVRSSYWLGDAEFIEFLTEGNGNDSALDFGPSSDRITAQIESDIKTVFNAYNRRIRILSREYTKGARRSFRILSPSFTPFEVMQSRTRIEVKISELRTAIARGTLSQEFIQARNLELTKLVDEYALLSEKMWKSISEFEKFEQDNWRYRSSILSIVSILTGVLIGIFGRDKFYQAWIWFISVLEHLWKLIHSLITSMF
jgi:hypothetical protein